jgi:hypothetical protein
VAIPAVNAKAADVVRVAEWDWLFAGLCRARGVIRAAQPVDCPDGKSQNKHGAKDSDPREGIGAVTEDLGHGLPVSPVKRKECIVSHQEYRLPSFRPKESLSGASHF